MDDALADVPTEVKAGFKTEMTGAEKIVHLPRLSVPAGAGHPRVISSRTSCFQPTDGQLAAIERAAVTLRPTSDDPRWARLRERHLFFENDLGDDVGPTLGGSDGGAVRPRHGVPPERLDPSLHQLGNGVVPSAPAWWWLQQTAGYVARPSARVERFADELAHSLNLTSNLGYVGYHDRAKGYIGYIGVHIRRGDKGSEAIMHDSSQYARGVREAALALGAPSVLVASDDPAAPADMSSLLEAHEDVRGAPYRVRTIPPSRWYMRLGNAPVVAAKMMERIHGDIRGRAVDPASDAVRRVDASGDEGEMQLAQLLLLARSSALVGTLTSNYLLLAYDMAVRLRHYAGEAPPALVDLDGNNYFACTVNHAPPWGPRFGKPKPGARRHTHTLPPPPPSESGDGRVEL